MQPQLIALTGYKFSGKSTIADYLVEKYGYVKINFKDALVEEVIEKFPELLKAIFDSHIEVARELGINSRYKEPNDLFNKPYMPEIRALLQNYGTNVRRADDPNYWVKKWYERLMLTPLGQKVVVDDCRFLNEMDAVRRKNGIIIRVIRKGQVSNDQHPSETEMDKIIPDLTWEVKDGVENLYQLVDKLMAE